MRHSTDQLVLLFTFVLAVFAHPTAGADATSIIRDGDVEIEVFVFGEGQTTLIIAAGNARPAAQLDGLAQSIAASGIRVVTYNYRSIGASKGPIVGTTLHDFADDVWRIADSLGLEKVHLAGKTFGNRVMRTAAADKPDRVAVPENAMNLATSRANTWMVGIPQCGHNMLYERPEDLRRLIVEYITQRY